MRAFCTVSAPLEVCAPPSRPLSPGSRFLALRLLGTPQPRTLYFLVEAKSRVREVYAQTCLHFAKQGMLDTELFGLAVLIDGEYMFVDPESKLSKYGPKSWRSSHTHGLDANGRPLLELHFRVQFYIESPFMLRDESSRHNYYLQLKSNSINRDVPKEYSEQSMILLGGLALQADLGDCPDDELIDTPVLPFSNTTTSNNNDNKNSGCAGIGNTNNVIISGNSSSSTSTASTLGTINVGVAGTSTATASSTSINAITTTSITAATNASAILEYFRSEEYIPQNMRSIWGANAIRLCHRENRGMTRSDAELNYIRQACSLHDAINAHVYRMKLSKNENGPGSVWFVIYAKGIKIYGENTQPITFLWPNIIKLSFERKKFEIRSGENRITLYSTSDEKNKMLLTLCKDTHQFSMKVAARLKEAIKREEEESSNCLHGCYIYSRSLNLPYKNKNDQRISVISSTSSNTTSGIVSDRVHSEDELEIMINTPPAIPIAAPSTESLALAHLLDQPSVSRQTSSVGQVSLKDLEDQLAALSIRSKTRSISSGSTGDHNTDVSRAGGDSNETDSPSSQHNIGSQCSSTCSTVVVATDTITLSSLAVHNTVAASTRRPSTSSSLELGFSHTAQNSILSEGASTCIDHEFASSHNDNENETASGVYTLAHPPPTETSGVYTMDSSEITEQSEQSSDIDESDRHENSRYSNFHSKNDLDDESMDNIDSVDGKYRDLIKDSNLDLNEFRLRSDSNVSASGSFRGDGSDPTDNKHNLLSAEELTDLIVGRGTYPSRKTVSTTLDSDCDYVTLPLSLGGRDMSQTEDNEDIDDIHPTDPPAPPKRIDSNVHHSLSSLVDIRTRSPPPYNARHEKTGLCGPPIRKEPKIVAAPPPYTQNEPLRSLAISSAIQHRTPTHNLVLNSCTSTKMLSEEVPARFITSRPQINILKAHASVVGENTRPCYAAPTITVPPPSRPQSASQASITTQINPVAISSTIGIPLVPYSIQTTHKSISSIPPPPPQYTEVKSSPRTCVLLPVLKPRQYLPPPPPTLPRQPPPPPPPQIATVYTSQLARSQIELYQQQLYSDVDYVIYPLQDPAVSQQEYLDAKQGSILAAMAQSPPPPSYLAYHHTSNPHAGTWDTCKNHAIYRSTPYLPLPLSTHSRYASTQNLSDTYVQLPGAYSPLYSPSVASLCSSYEPPPPPPLRPATISTTSSFFSRSKSDDNILNLCDTVPKIKRLPPPPPPPSYHHHQIKKPPMPAPNEKPPPIPAKSFAASTAQALLSKQSTVNLSLPQQTHHQRHHHQFESSGSIPLNTNETNTTTITTNVAVAPIDIQVLREKSKHLDLPLISALCNDRSLLKQTRAFVMPKHSRISSSSNNNLVRTLTSSTTAATATTTTTTIPIKTIKYPVSGLNETQLLSKPRKSSASHRHPNDKLPPLPIQPAEANNYVMDPASSSTKHKI